MRMLFCGDFVPGGKLHYQKEYVTTQFLEYINKFDLRICTLECAIGSNILYDEAKMQSTKAVVYSTNEDFIRIKELGINVVSLANNHITDLGKDGLENTIKLLDENDIKYFGAGKNLEQAKQPAVVCFDSISVAFIGCLFKGVAPTIFHSASEDEYGVYQTDIDTLVEDIQKAKNKYDKVIVMPHWAQEYNYMPPEYCYNYAKKMIDAGADAIIGSHPHIINPHIRYKEKDIYFSLGNFLFPDICLETPRPMYYPKETKDVYSLPRVWAYPSKIDTHSVAVWKKENRVGMIVDMSINNTKTITTTYKLTYLDFDNILCFYRGLGSFFTRLRLVLFGFFIKSSRYNYIRYIYKSKWNIFRRVKRLIQDIIQKKYIMD